MGKHQLLEYLLHSDRGCGDLRELANNNGDLPIHLAAKTGNLKSVRALLEWSDPDVRTRICIKQNKEGDTSLHVAVQYNHREVAKYLFNYCSEAAYYLNNNQIYPFFLAMNIWYDEIDMLTPMIKGLQNQKNLQLIRNHSMGVKSIIHETIKRRKIDILESLIDNAKDLFIHTYDDEGKNPLSYAASIGYFKGVQLLLQNFPSLEFECDQNEDGYFPIHHASKGGHIKIIKMLNLSICLLNNKQQNILHVAAEAGMHGVVCYLLKRQDHFKELVNIGDADGNTALHLAAKGCYTYTMLHLIREKHIDTNIINNELFSAGDVFTTNLHSAEDEQCIGLRKLILKSLFIADKKKILVRKRREKYDGNEVKEMEAKVQFKSTFNDNLLLVATLIVSVTYNSTFNPPGGYKGDSGVPSLISSTLFNSFMKFNILACTFSFVATITLIFTKFNPSPRLVHISQLNLCIGVTMLVVAYAMGCNSIPTHNSLENTLIVMLLLGIFVGILYHPICSFPNLVLRLLRK